MEKKNKFRDYRMVGLSVKAVVSAVPVAAVYVMAYLFLSSLSGAVTGLLLEKLTNAVLLKKQVYIWDINAAIILMEMPVNIMHPIHM
mgnify:CR=1 FL=1